MIAWAIKSSYHAEITEIVNIARCCPSGSHLRPTFTTPLFDLEDVKTFYQALTLTTTLYDLHRFDLWYKASGAGKVDIIKKKWIERTFFSQGEHLRLKVQQSSSECLEPESFNYIHNIDTTVIKIIIIWYHLHFSLQESASFSLVHLLPAWKSSILAPLLIVKTSVPDLNPWNHDWSVLDI